MLLLNVFPALYTLHLKCNIEGKYSFMEEFNTCCVYKSVNHFNYQMFFMILYHQHMLRRLYSGFQLPKRDILHFTFYGC